MAILVAHLGPTGTYTETAAIAYITHLAQQGQSASLCPYPSIAQTLRSVVAKEAHLAVVPVENSIQGSVTVTLDTLWQLEGLQIQQALVLPVAHALLSHASLAAIQTVYSHPQALAQCQQWLERHLPSAQLVSTNSTTEAIQHLQNESAGAIASLRAANLYNVPILAAQINDYPDNCTRFWVLGTRSTIGSYLSLAFSVADVPGSLVKPLQVFAQRGINLTRIESRPTKRSLGEYLFFVDLEGNEAQTSTQEALSELKACTILLKVLGNYNILPLSATATVS